DHSIPDHDGLLSRCIRKRDAPNDGKRTLAVVARVAEAGLSKRAQENSGDVENQSIIRYGNANSETRATWAVGKHAVQIRHEDTVLLFTLAIFGCNYAAARRNKPNSNGNFMGTQDPRIDAYIAKSADFAKPVLKHIRKLVHAAC